MSAALCTVESWPEAWRGAFEPWIERHGSTAWARRLPTALIVPARPAALHAKALMAVHGKAAPGLRIFTPGVLRDWLRGQYGDLAPTLPRERCELLLAVAAEACTGSAAETVARDPAPLRAALEAGAAAGWPLREVADARLHPVIERFERLLAATGEVLPQRAAWEISPGQPGARALFSEVFITGFDGAHWQHWPLLRAAASLAEQATVCLRLLGEESAAALDQVWIGTWEEHFGEAGPLAAEASGEDVCAPRFLALAEALSRGEECAGLAGEVRFLIGRDSAEQARLVVQQAAQFLLDPGCERVGILVPGPGPLARHIAAELSRRQIFHGDFIGHRELGPLNTPEFRAWLDFQESPRLPALLGWLRAGKALPGPFSGLARDEIERSLRRAWEHALFDDVASLGWACQAPEVKAALAALVRLPEAASAESFVSKTHEAFEQAEWSGHRGELKRETPAWFSALDAPLSRRAFLRWLRAALDTSKQTSATDGRETFSRVHLVSLAQAGAAAWSHVIIAGLNEGHWPPEEEDFAWLGEDAIATLNRRAAELNRRSVEQGSQGEGHAVAREGRALCLSARARRDLAWRDFLHFIATPSHGLALAAAASDEAAPDRSLNPSEFLNRLHFAVHGAALSHTASAALEARSHAWLEAGIVAPVPPGISAPLLRAYSARRDPTQPFGEFEFGFRGPPPQVRNLAATDWERALRQPAQVWLAKYLGIEPQEEPEGAAEWKKSMGTWVHRWLSHIVRRGEFEMLPSAGDIAQRVEEAATEFYDGILQMIASEGRRVPDWWASTWAEARALARHLASEIAKLPPGCWISAEWKLPPTALPHGASVHGKIDLLICSANPNRGAFPDAWVVDYKTGDKDALKAGKRGAAHAVLAKDGLQLLLYGLAMRQLGAASLKISRVSANAGFGDGQLTEAEVHPAALDPLLRGLARMQDSGCFGMRGSAWEEFAFVNRLPLATIEPDPAILEAKWRLTHPDLCADAPEDAA